MKVIKPGQKVFRSGEVLLQDKEEDDRTVELSFSSSTPVLREFIFDRFFEVLDHSEGSMRLDRFRNHAPLLIDHDNSVRSQVGVIESANIIDGREGRAVVRFGKSALDEEILQKVRDGIIRNVSFGYIVHNSVREKEKREGLDVFRVTDFEPLEISLVSVPADPGVGVGRDNSAIELIEIKKEVEDMQEVDNEVKKDSRAPDTEGMAQRAHEQAVKEETKRVRDIMAIGKQFASRGGVELAADAIEKGSSVQEFQNDMLKRLQTSEPEKDVDRVKVEERSESDGKNGFQSLGHFVRYVHAQKLGYTMPDGMEVRASATNWASVNAGSDGAYLIPPDFSAEIARFALEETSLFNMMNPTPIQGNSMTFVRDETTPWGTDGVNAYWEKEAAALTQTKPTYEKAQLSLHKLTALTPATDELLEDATAMSAEIPRAMGIAIDWKVQDAIVNGVGAGMPLGIMNAGALVTQAKETSQAADTIVAKNVVKMLARLIKGAGSIVWLANPDATPEIYTMTLGDQPIWTPPSEGFKQAPNGFLLGRPIIETEACQTLGDKGDLILVNMAGYRAITKAGGMQLAQSMHLWFDQSIQAFRLVFRLDAQPRFQAAITPPNSSVTRSHMVTLAART